MQVRADACRGDLKIKLGRGEAWSSGLEEARLAGRLADQAWKRRGRHYSEAVCTGMRITFTGTEAVWVQGLDALELRARGPPPGPPGGCGRAAPRGEFELHLLSTSLKRTRAAPSGLGASSCGAMCLPTVLRPVVAVAASFFVTLAQSLLTASSFAATCLRTYG